MTDNAMAHQPSHMQAPAASPLAILSLSAPTETQPDFDEMAALIHAASAEDSSVEEVALLRVLVFRRSHPHALMQTRLERFGDEQVVVRARITLDSGATASAHAVAEGGVAGIERAEHRALGRALEFLGEVVLVNVATSNEMPEFDDALSDAGDSAETGQSPHDGAPVGIASDLDAWDDDEELTDPPSPEPAPDEIDDDDMAPEAPHQPAREIPPPRFRATPPRERPTARERDSRPQREPEFADNTTPQDTAPPPAVVDAVRRANLRRQGIGQSERVQDEPIEPHPQSPSSHGAEPADDDAPLESYSWTAFWRVARPQGLDKIKVEQIIGEPITPLTPLQVREKLKAAGYDL